MVRVEPGDADPGNTVEGGKLAGNENLSILLNGEGTNRIVRPQAGVAGDIEAAIRIDAGDSILGLLVVRGEIASDQHFAIILERDGEGGGAIVDPGSGSKQGVDSAR